MTGLKQDDPSISSVPVYGDVTAVKSPGLTLGGGEVEGVELDADAMRLAQMGYTQDMQRNFSVVSLLGVAFSLANSWFGISVYSFSVLLAGSFWEF